MPGGQPPANHNRFKGLNSDEELTFEHSKKKNKRSRHVDFPNLPHLITNEDDIPRYIIAASKPKDTEHATPLASFNVFIVEKGLKCISREYSEVTEMKSGDLLIKVNNIKAAEKFIRSSTVAGIPVKFTYHRSLNCSQGRIYSKKIITLTDDELLEGLADQQVIEVRKMYKSINGELTATGSAILTFNLIKRPEKINLGWERLTVSEYIRSPMRCKNCQKIGHTKKWCRNNEICEECGLPKPHSNCTRSFCVNCNIDSHSSKDASCPTYLKHKSIIKIKTDKRCSNREAWKIYNENPTAYHLTLDSNKQSYAQAAATNTHVKSINITNDSTKITSNTPNTTQPSNYISTNNIKDFNPDTDISSATQNRSTLIKSAITTYNNSKEPNLHSQSFPPDDDDILNNDYSQQLFDDLTKQMRVDQQNN